jgi:competence protein ComEC
VTWRVAKPSAVAFIAYYVLVAAAWTSWRRAASTGTRESVRHSRYRLTATVLACAAALWILVDPRTIVAAYGDGRLHTTFIDVGQGDSIFVVFPRGSTLLVDAGGLGFSSSFDVGDRVVAPVIRTAGFRRIDRLAVTHGDPDHVGGALAIMREFQPREVWEGIPVPKSDALTRLRTTSQALGARWANVYAGASIDVDGVAVKAIHPQPAEWERQKVRNDDSLVVELRWRDVSIVLTGDIGRAAEQRIAGALPQAPVRIVKVPHHGSLTSSTIPFLEALAPAIAIVSAGRNNHFGHPVPEVLARYAAAGAAIYRTDRDGAIDLTTDGYAIVVRTFTDTHEGTKNTKGTKS